MPTLAFLTRQIKIADLQLLNASVSICSFVVEPPPDSVRDLSVVLERVNALARWNTATMICFKHHRLRHFGWMLNPSSRQRNNCIASAFFLNAVCSLAFQLAVLTRLRLRLALNAAGQSVDGLLVLISVCLKSHPCVSMHLRVSKLTSTCRNLHPFAVCTHRRASKLISTCQN